MFHKGKYMVRLFNRRDFSAILQNSCKKTTERKLKEVGIRHFHTHNNGTGVGGLGLWVNPTVTSRLEMNYIRCRLTDYSGIGLYITFIPEITIMIISL